MEQVNNTRKTFLYLCAAVVAALCLRLWLLQFYPDWMHGMTLIGEARNLFHGYGYTIDVPNAQGIVEKIPSVYDVPGYAFLHLFFWKIFGGFSLIYTQILQILLDSSLCILIYRLAREVLSVKGAIVAAFLYALYIPEATLAANAGRDFWTTLTFLFSTLCFLFFLRGRGFGWMLLSAFLLGIGCYFRPTMIYFPLFLGLTSWIRQRRFWKACGQTVCMLLIVHLILFPWALRNHRLTGKWIFTRYVVGQALWMGAGQFQNPYGAINHEELALKQMQERGFPGTSNSTVEYEDFIRPLAVSQIKEHPGWYVGTVLKRIPMALLINRIPWGNMGSAKYSYHQKMYIGREAEKNIFDYALKMLKLDPWLIVTKVFDALILGFALLGLYLRRKYWREDFLLWSITLYLILVHIPINVEGRYMVPGHWVYLIFATVALQKLRFALLTNKLLGLINNAYDFSPKTGFNTPKGKIEECLVDKSQ